MKDRKLNAYGGRIGYAGGGKAGLPAVTMGTAPNEYATTSNACRTSTRGHTWGNDSGSESNATGSLDGNESRNGWPRPGGMPPGGMPPGNLVECQDLPRMAAEV